MDIDPQDYDVFLRDVMAAETERREVSHFNENLDREVLLPAMEEFHIPGLVLAQPGLIAHRMELASTVEYSALLKRHPDSKSAPATYHNQMKATARHNVSLRQRAEETIIDRAHRLNYEAFILDQGQADVLDWEMLTEAKRFMVAQLRLFRTLTHKDKWEAFVLRTFPGDVASPEADPESYTTAFSEAAIDAGRRDEIRDFQNFMLTVIPEKTYRGGGDLERVTNLYQQAELAQTIAEAAANIFIQSRREPVIYEAARAYGLHDRFTSQLLTQLEARYPYIETHDGRDEDRY